MDGSMKFPGRALMMVGIVPVALIGLALFSGCERKQPTAQQTSGQQPASADNAEVKAVALEQTTCPVMGGAIDKAIFVEYKGKKVYFCCKGCPETFLANPEKYLAKLPQFQK
jgi:YHS domain-containing protein